jgi:hypothetical protein
MQRATVHRKGQRFDADFVVLETVNQKLETRETARLV